MKQWITLLLALSAITAVSAAEHEVKMLSWGKEGPMVYEPSVLQVEVGDTVTFLPAQPGHQVKSHTIPEGAEAFTSPLDEKFTITLDKEGIYLYYCPPHRMMNMSGLIQVGSPVNREAIDSGIAEIEKLATNNKGRLIAYIKRLDQINQSPAVDVERTDTEVK